MFLWIIVLTVLLSAISAPGEALSQSLARPAQEAAIQGGAGSNPGGDAIKPLHLTPVGRIVKEKDRVSLEIFPEFAPALDGLKTFSHIWVLFWFHENDTPENRSLLKVHPRRDPANPLTGVFATRAPVRPNLIGLTACRLQEVAGSRLTVEGLDANNGSPILDIKPYIPESDSHPEAKTPDWVRRR